MPTVVQVYHLMLYMQFGECITIKIFLSRLFIGVKPEREKMDKGAEGVMTSVQRMT